MSKKTSFYDRLGIPQNASEEEIRKAYRAAARRLHPDVNVQSGATEMFLNIKEAYEVLIDPNQKSTYDGQTGTKPPPPPPIRINTYYSSTAITVERENQLHYALLEMEVLSDQSKEGTPSPPTNVALVLDHSTSMQGARLDMVKASAIEILRQLRTQDIISIISFNDHADVLLPAGSYAGDRKHEASVRIPQAGGGTEIFQGLEAGYHEVRKNLLPSNINHIILITDGHTYGDEPACRKLANEAAELGIGISCLGIGSEWNDEFMDELAEITGGSCLYIKKPHDIRKLLKQKLDGLGQIYAERISFNFNLGPGVELKYAFRLKPETGVLTTSSPLRLGNIPKGSRQRVLIEFLIHPFNKDVEKILLVEGDLKFDIPKRGNTAYRIPITMVRSVVESLTPEPPPHTLVEAMSKLTLYRMQERAKNELAAGEYKDATRSLQNMATHLFAQGEPELAKTVITEAQHIEKEHTFSQDGEKEIKYGTRALLLPEGLS